MTHFSTQDNNCCLRCDFVWHRNIITNQNAMKLFLSSVLGGHLDNHHYKNYVKGMDSHYYKYDDIMLGTPKMASLHKI